jgi:hypothetical protein
MRNIVKLGVALLSSAAVGGCVGGGGNPFGNPFGGAPPVRVASAGSTVVSAPPPVVAPPAATGGRPSVTVNASPKRVQDTIIARAQRRGTTILGANLTGVTLEIPLRQSSEVVVSQCGPHRDGRTLRVYLETIANGPGTTVSEDRFVIDGGTTSCQLSLTQADVEEANRSLADLKSQSEAPRTASAQRPADPAGGLAPLNPGRPVVPLRP